MSECRAAEVQCVSSLEKLTASTSSLSKSLLRHMELVQGHKVLTLKGESNPPASVFSSMHAQLLHQHHGSSQTLISVQRCSSCMVLKAPSAENITWFNSRYYVKDEFDKNKVSKVAN